MTCDFKSGQQFPGHQWPEVLISIPVKDPREKKFFSPILLSKITIFSQLEKPGTVKQTRKSIPQQDQGILFYPCLPL